MEVHVGANNPLAKVELFIECKHLPNLDTLSLSDPQVIIYTKYGNDGDWREVGKTEVIQDNLNPKFSKSVLLDYYFEKVQPLKFRVIDVDERDFDEIGEVMVTLGSIVGSKGSELVSQITHPKRRHSGALIVRALTIEDSNRDVIFNFRAMNLDKKDFFGKSDPFLEINRKMDDGSWILVHRTEYILKTLNPQWNTFTIPLHKLNGGDMSKPIKISCWDWNKNGKMDFIGDFTSDLNSLQNKGNFPFVNEKKRKKGGKYTNSGTLVVNEIKLVEKHTFLEYIAGGTEINLMVAIDYTASNGDPKYSNSLHYMNPYEPNEYSSAIKAVGSILMDYDSDGKIPLYGFGAKLNNGTVSHCFNVNGQRSPEVNGIDEALRAYQASFTNRVIKELYGPTNMGTIIKTARNCAKEMHATETDIQAYLILLILTDGEITDMDDTVHEIVEASYLPMSIVIVGVGQADFTKMEILDGDDSRLKSRGKTAERDIVQFVPYREYKRSTSEALAAAVLAEIPGQFMDYMNQHKIIPHPPPDEKEQEIMRQRALEQALITQAGLQHNPTILQNNTMSLQYNPTVLQNNPTNLQHNPTMFQQNPNLQNNPTNLEHNPTVLQNNTTNLQHYPSYYPQTSFYYPQVPPQGQGYPQSGYPVQGQQVPQYPGYPQNMVYVPLQNPGENTNQIPVYPLQGQQVPQYPGYPQNMVYPTVPLQNPGENTGHVMEQKQ